MAETIHPAAPHGQAVTPLILWRYVIVGVLVGATVWFISPFVQDQREPWDSPYFIYRGGLLLGGLLLGFLQPRPLGRGLANAWVGAWAGQIPFIAFSEFRSLGLIATAFGALFFAGGTFIGAMFRRRWKAKTA